MNLLINTTAPNPIINIAIPKRMLFNVNMELLLLSSVVVLFIVVLLSVVLLVLLVAFCAEVTSCVVLAGVLGLSFPEEPVF